MQHYRWDFIGLSTDTKPTPQNSEKVVDGSTFYCSDTSKLYVFCKDNWYEKVVEGGGGGTTYTAGDGIDITNDVISNKEVVTLQYLDYNPNNELQPATVFPEWLIEQGIKPGQTVKLEWRNQVSGSNMKFNMGIDYADNSIYKSLGYVYPGIVLFVTAYNSSGTNTNSGYLKILVDTSSSEKPLSEWCWEFNINDEYFLFSDRKILNTENVGGLNESEYLKEAFSFTGGNRLNCILNSATNIENVGKVELDTSQYSGSTLLTFDITSFHPSDPAGWGGEMEIDSDFQSYDFSQASVNDQVYVYVRNINGLPFAFKPEFPSDFIFYLTDSNDNVIEVPGLVYAYGSGGYSVTNDPVEVRPDFLFCLKLIEADTWVVVNQSAIAYYLPRSLSGGSGLTFRELTSADYNYPEGSPYAVGLWKLEPGFYYWNTSSYFPAYVNASQSNQFNVQAVSFICVSNNNGYADILVYGKPFSGLVSDDYTSNAMVSYRTEISTGNSIGREILPSHDVADLLYHFSFTGGIPDSYTIGDTNALTYSQPDQNYYQLVKLTWNTSEVRWDKEWRKVCFDFLDTSAPTNTTKGVLGQLYTDTTGMHTYQCTAIDTTDPDNPLYTWTQRW